MGAGYRADKSLVAWKRLCRGTTPRDGPQVGGVSEDDLEDDAGVASSGGSVYEDPLGDTPLPAQAEAGALAPLATPAPTHPAARELLVADDDGVELFSNARFRADSPASSAASSNDAQPTALERDRSPCWLQENQFQ